MSENRDQILEAIRVQGDLVRTLKAAKEAPEKVCFFSSHNVAAIFLLICF